jgi:4-amino-4-deoxy-L-arabinose transferase-like glycosyltransferase
VEKTDRSRWAVPAILVAITLAGLGLRLGYAIDQPAAPPPDAEAYARIAESLFRDGGFDARPPGVDAEVQPSSAYSPGLPLLVAGLYELTGGVHLTFALIVLALLGAAAVPLVFLLGRRFAGPVAGLIGAGVLAVYPALLDYQGLLLTEPLAAFLLSLALALVLIRPEDGEVPAEAPRRRGVPWRWLGAGAAFGLLVLVRPEYLPIALGLPLLWLAREALRGRVRGALFPVAASLLATCLVIAPWTIRNAIELDRFVPVSTGGGKALFIGSYVAADGDGPKLRELLLDERPALKARYEAGGALDDPDRLILERLLARVAAEEEPNLEVDDALGRLGRRNLEDAISEQPGDLFGMWTAKAYDTWTEAARSVMLRQPWRALQLALVVLGLAGVAILAWRRRFEALVAGAVLLYMTAVGAILIASPRRELVVLPLLAALAGAALVEGARLLRRPRRG